MSAAIEPGMWVECVEAGGFASNLRVGRLYVVEEVYNDGQICGPRCDGGIVRLGAFKNGGYCARRFRPIYRPYDDLIASLKQPAPETVRELIGEGV